jgi:NADPH-dependent 2,4-dienoyl-CoA reductase/sulfur reductase-like enzyme
MKRRDLLRLSGAVLAGAALRPAGALARGPIRRVVVVGAGFAGATAAKYLRMGSDDIDVILVERGIEFVSCPLSNLVIGGFKTITDVKTSFFWVSAKYGIKLATDEAVAIDADKQQVRLARSGAIDYDRLVVAPGIDFVWEEVPGMGEADARVLHAWKAGRQTTALRKQLEDMADGGVFVISVPLAPYRGLAGPYERACLVAAYFRQAKPRSKILILDANPDVMVKGAQFRKAWADLYPGMIEYRANSRVTAVDAAARTAQTVAESVKADVLNVVPPMKAGKLAEPLVAKGGRWCEVDFTTFESRAVPNVHVLGDSLLSPPGMPKSGHLANAQGKACAAAILALASGKAPEASPTLADDCYSFIGPGNAIRSSATYRYDRERSAMTLVEGPGAPSGEPVAVEARQAMSWAQKIWTDMLK